MIGYKTVTIIGAGASGLMAAVTAADSGAYVTIIEGNDKIGKKIYATGNGHCNFTNINASAEDYNDPEDGFVEEVLSTFTPEQCINFFKEESLLSRIAEEGRCYPYSEQASSVAAMWERSLKKRKIKLITGDRADDIKRILLDEGDEGSEKDKKLQKFEVMCESGSIYVSEALIIACGGRAGLQFGSTGDGYGFAKKMGHTLSDIRPALVAAEASDSSSEFMKAVKGVRAKGSLSLYEDGKIKSKSNGEIQFTGTGISGICMFDLSRYMDAPRPVSKKKSVKKRKNNMDIQHEYEISADLIPDMSENDVKELIYRFMEDSQSSNSLFDAISGIVDLKIARALISEHERENSYLIEYAAKRLKDIRIKVASTKGWEHAQVTRGGVCRNEIDPSTMGSKIVSGLYFCGEVVDVDGRCGGFNLQWAWASGHLAGQLVSKGKTNA